MLLVYVTAKHEVLILKNVFCTYKSIWIFQEIDQFFTRMFQHNDKVIILFCNPCIHVVRFSHNSTSNAVFNVSSQKQTVTRPMCGDLVSQGHPLSFNGSQNTFLLVIAQIHVCFKKKNYGWNFTYCCYMYKQHNLTISFLSHLIVWHILKRILIHLVYQTRTKIGT